MAREVSFVNYMQKVRTLTWEYVISMHSALLFVFC